MEKMDHNFAASHAVADHGERSEPLLAPMETLSGESDCMEIRKNKKGAWLVTIPYGVHYAEPLRTVGRK